MFFKFYLYKKMQQQTGPWYLLEAADAKNVRLKNEKDGKEKEMPNWMFLLRDDLNGIIEHPKTDLVLLENLQNNAPDYKKEYFLLREEYLLILRDDSIKTKEERQKRILSVSEKLRDCEYTYRRVKNGVYSSKEFYFSKLFENAPLY